MVGILRNALCAALRIYSFGVGRIMGGDFSPQPFGVWKRFNIDILLRSVIQ